MSRAERAKAVIKQAKQEKQDYREKKKLKAALQCMLPVLLSPEDLNLSGFNKIWREGEDPITDLKYFYPDCSWDAVCAYAGTAVKVQDLLNPKKFKDLPVMRYFRKCLDRDSDGIYVVFSCVGYNKPWILTNRRLPPLPALLPRIVLEARNTAKDITIINAQYFVPAETE